MPRVLARSGWRHVEKVTNFIEKKMQDVINVLRTGYKYYAAVSAQPNRNGRKWTPPRVLRKQQQKRQLRVARTPRYLSFAAGGAY